MSPIRILSVALVVLTGTCSCSALAATDAEIRQGIVSAIEKSDLNGYTKRGCLRSLQVWADERAPPKFARRKLKGALFFLGDSYLSYNFSFVGIDRGKPTLLRQIAEGPDQASLSSDELSQLTSLVSAARFDKPPSIEGGAVHQTCVVFYTPQDGYFVVRPDENQQSDRSTDLAIRFMSKVSPDAP